MNDPRGFFGIGIEHGKNVMNYGTLHRTAQILGASMLFTVGRRFRRQCSDTMKSWRHIPTFSYDNLASLVAHMPYDCRIVGIELDDRAQPLEEFKHPQRALYLLGAEDHGLTNGALAVCHKLVRLRGERSMNVSVAGSIVLYHRITQTLEAA